MPLSYGGPSCHVGLELAQSRFKTLLSCETCCMALVGRDVKMSLLVYSTGLL